MVKNILNEHGLPVQVEISEEEIQKMQEQEAAMLEQIEGSE